LGVVGTLMWGVRPDPANSLRALVDRRLREKVSAANRGSDVLRAVHVAGIGHEFWVDEQAGFSHSGWGLKLSDEALPSYEIPPFDGIGANEYIVDVVHDAVDFISSVDTPAPWELNIWYHTLNCGYRAKLSGETDFPCIYGERVGLGRVYVKLDDGQLDFDRWCEGVKQGRSYVSDGHSHLIDFRVNDAVPGVSGGELKLAAPGPVKVTAQVAAYLDSSPS